MKSLKEVLDPVEPEMPEDVAEFIKTDFGKKVHEYYMAELEFVMNEGYKEARDMVKEERRIAEELRKEIKRLKGEAGA